MGASATPRGGRWGTNSVSRRLAVWFGVAAAILCALVSAAGSSLLGSRSVAVMVSHENIARLEASQRLLTAFYRMQLGEDGFLTHVEQKYRDDFHEASADADRALALLGDQGLDLDPIARGLKRYRELFDAQEEILSGRVTTDDPAVFRAYSIEEDEVVSKLDLELGGLSADQLARTRLQVDRMADRLGHSVALVLLAFLVALIALGVTHKVGRDVARGLRRLTVEVSRVAASGSLDHRVEIQQLEELAQLGVTFNGMMAGLEDIDVLTRAAAEKLAASEESFRSLIEHLPVAVSLFREERLVWANQVAVRLLGATRLSQVEGTGFCDFLRPDDHPEAKERYLRIARGEQVAPVEHELTGLDQVVRTIEVTGARLTFHGQLSNASIALDVTERKQLWRQLHFNERMTSLGTLAAGVAHEINNPIAFVSSNLTFVNELVAQMTHSGEEWVELVAALADAQEGARRVALIVKALKSFAREDDDHPQSAVEVGPLLEFSISMARAAVNDRARLVTDFAVVPPVSGSEGPLGQVFLNLLMNAAQAIAPGAPRDNVVEVGSRLEPDGRIAVYVRDTGSGMGPEVQKRLFDPFFSTKPVGVGTGLGLSISLGIVQKLGGEIRVDSEPGKGSTFTVYLHPASQPESAAASTG